MKYFVYFCFLAALLSLALAEPDTQESAGQARIESEGPADVERAVAQLLRQEGHVESSSSQQVAIWRCYNRGLVIVCYWR